MKSINPKDNLVIKSYEEYSGEKTSSVIDSSHNAFKVWSDFSFKERSNAFIRLASELQNNSLEYAKLMTDEMGKPISQAKSEIEKCIWVCKFYAENAEKFLETKNIDTDYSLSEVNYRPLGVILGIMPWNFPFWQVLRFAAPTMMAGNTVVLKHASNVQGCALAIDEAFNRAGFPANAFSPLVVGSDKIKAVIENPKVKAVSLTGSTGAGKKVAEIAGKNLKKTLLELGGSDPYIIMEDADLEEAAKRCVQSRMQNNGQSCIGAKRFIVMDKVYDEFKNLFIKEMKTYSITDPLEKEAKLGPMAKVSLRDELHDQVQKSLDMGAHLVIGGDIPKKEGAYYYPTIIENVKKGMPAYDEELFGPVATLFRAKDIDEAIHVANDTSFGLGSGIFTSDKDFGLKVAREKLNSGASFVNDFVKSDPRLPFGGVGESGYGRELSIYGILEFVNVKTVCFDQI